MNFIVTALIVINDSRLALFSMLSIGVLIFVHVVKPLRSQTSLVEVVTTKYFALVFLL